MSTTKKKTKKKITKKRATKNQFTAGHTRSKGFGRPALTPEEKELSLRTRTQFRGIINRYMLMSNAELAKIYKARNTPALDGMIVKAIQNARKSGDTTNINWLANHILGKEKESTNINLNSNIENTDMVDIKNMSNEDLIAMKEIRERTEKSKKNK